MIGAIFAIDSEGGFGNKGKIPWNVPEDYAHFKRVTIGGKIVMGRGTFESLPKLLPNREHIVISSTLEPGEGYKVYSTPGEVLEHEGNNFWVIGGPSIIHAFRDLGEYDIIYLSTIYGTHEHDVRFDNLDELLIGMTVLDERIYDDFEVTKFISETNF